MMTAVSRIDGVLQESDFQSFVRSSQAKKGAIRNGHEGGDDPIRQRLSRVEKPHL